MCSDSGDTREQSISNIASKSKLFAHSVPFGPRQPTSQKRIARPNICFESLSQFDHSLLLLPSGLSSSSLLLAQTIHRIPVKCTYKISRTEHRLSRFYGTSQPAPSYSPQGKQFGIFSQRKVFERLWFNERKKITRECFEMGEAEVTKPGNNHPFFGCTYRRYIRGKERLGIRQGWLGKAQFHSFFVLNCVFFSSREGREVW